MRVEERGENLVIVDFDECEAYRIACKIERDGIELYQDISLHVKNARIKETVDFLIQEEKKHLRFFEECLSAMREKGEDYSEDNDLLSSMDFGVFPSYRGTEDIENIIKDMKKILLLAISAEDKSIKFYTACKDNLISQDTQREIANIIKEEERHKRLLSDMLTGVS